MNIRTNYWLSTCPGYYWIDPNLGMSDDAVKVHCDMEQGGETCVFPDVHASKMPNIPWRKSGNGWYSSLRGGFKVCCNNINLDEIRRKKYVNMAKPYVQYTCLF